MKITTFPFIVVALLLCVAAAPAADNIAKKVGAKSAPLKVHPKVFSMVDCWLSDSEAPVVTEFNLDAVEGNNEQFNMEEVKTENGWTRSPNEDGSGFFRYLVLEAKENRYKIEFQSNGGGTLTTKSHIECVIEKREIKVNGTLKTTRVLRITGYSAKTE